MAATDNAEQIAEWNGAQGRTWAESMLETGRVVSPFGAAAMTAAAAQQGERVIDIGCGCGDTALELARQVGASGSVLGVDVSAPMLVVARSRGAEAGLDRLSFRDADASTAELPSGCDLLYSRFGVMFFARPELAFAHLRGALRPGGRCVFVCWRAPRDNPWAMAPLAAARAALGITAVPADPLAPGPFAFADDVRLRAILADAGFAAIDLRRFDAPVELGASARVAARGRRPSCGDRPRCDRARAAPVRGRGRRDPAQGLELDRQCDESGAGQMTRRAGGSGALA
jgi:ubiquinone/menaquinone biosynthesis C-methylase UbiE